jgi:hypothetical protein
VSGFRINFTLQGGGGLFTSPPFDSLELALKRAAALERQNKATIERIVGSEGYFFLDRDGCPFSAGKVKSATIAATSD